MDRERVVFKVALAFAAVVLVLFMVYAMYAGSNQAVAHVLSIGRNLTAGNVEAEKAFNRIETVYDLWPVATVIAGLAGLIMYASRTEPTSWEEGW